MSSSLLRTFSALPASPKPPLVVVDASYLAHRAQWTTGELSYRGRPTGMLFGFLLQVRKIRKLFPSNALYCFAWDSMLSIRREIYPEYKARRKEVTLPEEQKHRDDFYFQMNQLRPEVLEPLGFKNHLKCEKYEADDIIASLCRCFHPDHEIFIVSSDHDLYQLLHMATMYMPHQGKNFNQAAFERQFGILPSQWAKAMSIAGCDGDNVPGVFGVGEKTACDYIAERYVKPTLVEAIKRHKRLIERNLRLVSLPFDGKDLVPHRFSLIPYKMDVQGLNRINDQFGFHLVEREWA